MPKLFNLAELQDIPELNDGSSSPDAVQETSVYEVPEMTKLAIKSSICYNLIYEYANFLVTSGVCDSKESCLERIGVLVSRLIDTGVFRNGSAILETLKSRITNSDWFSVSDRSKKEARINELIERVSEHLTAEELPLDSSEFKTLMDKWTELFSKYHSCRYDVHCALRPIVNDCVVEFFSEYGSAIEPLFVERYVNK